MQSLLLPVTATETIDNAKQNILNRSPLYDKDKNKFYIKYNDELNLIQTQVDNDNIVLNENNEVALADDIHCKSVTVKPDESGIVYKANVLFAETTDERTIILISKINENNGAISGNLYIDGDDISGGYHFTVTSAGTRYLEGTTSASAVTYMRVTYNDEEYIGIKFLPNTKIYFSGYDLRNEYIMPPAYDTYDDKSHTKIIDIVNESNNKTENEEIENPLKTNWDFTVPCAGLDDENKTKPLTEYDLTDGLYINSEYNNSVYFYPDEVTNDDKGYITLGGAGKALKLVLTKDNSSLKILFSSNVNNAEARTLVISNETETIETALSDTKDVISTLKTSELKAGTYYIGTTSSRIRIYRLALIPPQANIIVEGHEAINYDWDFRQKPDGWVEGESTDFGNGLQMIRSEGGTYEIYGNTTNYNDTGYFINNLSNAYLFYIDVPHNNATFTIKYTTGRRGANRYCSLVDDQGNTLTSSWTGQYPSALTTLTYTFNKGRYFIWQNAPLQVYHINLSIPYEEQVEEEISYAEKVVESIGGLEETGETGDPHYMKISDIALSLQDLKDIADKLKDSDRKIHLDLTECFVRDDAKEWNGLFNKCLSLSYLGMPQGVTKIGPDTFVGCIFLEKIKFCESITTFESSSGTYVFSGNRVRTFILPYKCAKIGWNTFANSGARHIIVPPNSINSFKSMLVYGSFFNTLDYIKIYMTQEEFNRENYELTWEHDNYMGDNKDTKISDHITIYDDINKLLSDLNYGEGY